MVPTGAITPCWLPSGCGGVCMGGDISFSPFYTRWNIGMGFMKGWRVWEVRQVICLCAGKRTYGVLGAELSLPRDEGWGADPKKEAPQKKHPQGVLATNPKYSLVVGRTTIHAENRAWQKALETAPAAPCQRPPTSYIQGDHCPGLSRTVQVLTLEVPCPKKPPVPGTISLMPLAFFGNI